MGKALVSVVRYVTNGLALILNAWLSISNT